jgi:hypothetical protein
MGDVAYLVAFLASACESSSAILQLSHASPKQIKIANPSCPGGETIVEHKKTLRHPARYSAGNIRDLRQPRDRPKRSTREVGSKVTPKDKAYLSRATSEKVDTA